MKDTLTDRAAEINAHYAAKRSAETRVGAGGMDIPAESAEGVESRFRAATAILDGMDADGLRRLAAEIERRLAAQGV